jgi:SPP1 family predicted phage head-tail adaptor
MKSPTIEAGRLRHQVQLSSLSATQDALGGEVPSGSPYATCWAAIEPLTGQELYQAQQYVKEVSHRVSIRYLPGVNAADVVIWSAPGGSTRTFTINAVINPQEVDAILQLLCLERNDSGAKTT